MKNRLKLTLIAILLLSVGTINAQSDDFGVWTSVEGVKEIVPKLNFGLKGEFRTRDDIGTVDRWTASADLSYRPCKYLKAGISYYYLYLNHEKRGWERGHRYNLYLQGYYQWNRFTFSLRERYQYTYRAGVEKTETRANPKKVFRSRLQASYSIAQSGFSPYVSCEFFNKINDPQKNELEKIRYTVGTEYKLSKVNTLNTYYRYDEGKLDGMTGLHVLGIGFTHKFK